MTGPLDFLTSIDPRIVWGLFTRLLGLVYLIAFASLFPQIVPMAGVAGIFPVHRWFARLRKDFPPQRRFTYFPTLLWFAHTDAALPAWCMLGMFAAATVIVGGPSSFIGLLACWALYLSFDLPMGLLFPWDCVLLESGFLALFLGPTEVLPSIAAVAPPAPLLAWVYRLLIVRVVFGFGKFKFTTSSREDWGYLKGFLINQPLPSYLGWYAHKLPMWMLKASLLVMFVVEIPVPVLILIPGYASAIGAVAIFLLMIAIELAGSFGFFSLIMMVLCVSALDSQTPRLFSLHDLFSTPRHAMTSVVLLAHTFGALLHFPLNSWATHRWLLWSAFAGVRPRFLTWPVSLLRALYPLRWLHAYGVFPPKTWAGVKVVPVLEVTWDGNNWQECRFRYAPTHEGSPPRFVSPHRHRVDQAVIYEVFGMNGTAPIASVIGAFAPYYYTRWAGGRGLLQRIVEGYRYSDYLFEQGAFPKERGRPLAARMTTHMLEPTSIVERRATGKWWRRTYIGPHIPPVSYVDDFWDRLLPEPDLWHWEELFWRRRCPSMRKFMDAARASTDPDGTIIAHAEGITRADIDEFWNVVWPMVRGDGTGDWNQLTPVVKRLTSRYSPKQLHLLERVLGRLSLFLVAKLEQLYFADNGQPKLELKTYFHVSMMAHYILLKGRPAYEAAVADPASTIPLAAELTMANGCYLLGVFQYDAVVFQAQKRRLTQRFIVPLRESSNFGPTFEEEKARVALEKLSGAVEFGRFLESCFCSEPNQQGFPEKYPTFWLSSSGEVTIVDPATVPPARPPDLVAARQRP